MSEDIAQELGLPPLDQVGYVVQDLDRAMEIFGALFGPFRTMESELKGTLYRGRRSDVKLRMGFARSGPVEIELIEWVSGDSPHREMLEKHGEGVHHIRFRVDELAESLERLKSLGFDVVWHHEMPEIRASWAYLEGPANRGGALIELLQLPAELG